MFNTAGGVGAAGSCVKDKGRLHFQYINGNGETKTIALWVPAPDLSYFDKVEGVGYRMQDSAGAAIAAALQSLTGITPITFVHGVLDYRESEPNSRNGSCLEFKDVLGAKAWMAIPQPTSLAALQAFTIVIDSYSLAVVMRGSMETPNVMVVPTGDPLATTQVDTNGLDCVERTCNVRMAYLDGTDRRWMSFNLAAPQSAYLTREKDSKGWKLIQATGNLLSSAINTLYGSANRATVFKSGRVKHSEKDTQ